MLYTILVQEEFVSLYKYGQIPFDSKRLIEAENKNEADAALLEGLKAKPYFEYEEEVLILEVDRPAKEVLRLSEVRALIPLSEGALQRYKRKFDPRLVFQPPKFEYLLEGYFEHISLMEHKQGAEVLSQMCNCEIDGSTIVSDEEFKEAFQRKSRGERSHSFQRSFFTHLLVYERYEAFEHTDVGFLYDLGTALANSKGKPQFSGGAFLNYLQRNHDRFKDMQLKDIFRDMENAAELEGLKRHLTSSEGIRLYQSAAIFLKYKHELKETESIYDTTLERVVGKKRKAHEFIREFEVAIYLTGLFFGFQKFNAEYYELAQLRVFGHSSQEPEKKTDQLPESPQVTDDTEQQDFEPLEPENNEGGGETSELDKGHPDQHTSGESEAVADGEGKEDSLDITPEDTESPESGETGESEVPTASEETDTEGKPADEKAKTEGPGQLDLGLDNKTESPAEKKGASEADMNDDFQIGQDEAAVVEEEADSLPTPDEEWKHEKIFSRIEVIFNTSQETRIRISDIHKTLKKFSVRTLRKIAQEDPKNRFTPVQDGAWYLEKTK